jgi:hypothetical protein
MLKRDELANPESCLNKADTLEPLFVLRANDENAPASVAAWARDYIIAKGGWGKMTAEQQAKYTEAMDNAGDMQAQKRFYLTFAIDVMSAAALGAAEASALMAQRGHVK